MCKKLFFLISFVLLLGLVNNASADDIAWDDGDPCDHRWDSPLNWSNDALPSCGTCDEGGDCYEIYGGYGVVNGPFVDANVTFENGGHVMTIIVGAWEGGTNDGMTMTGGHLFTDWEVILGLTTDTTGTLNMSGGLIELDGSELFIGMAGTGYLNMTGGTIDANGGAFAMPGYVDWNHSGRGEGTGFINFDGGSILCGSIFMRDAAALGGVQSIIDVNGGTLIIDGDERGILTEYIDKGWITGSDESDPRYVSIVYDDVNDITILTHDPTPDYNMPWRPIPGVGERITDWKPTLSWQPGQYAATHTVYFGSSLSDVNAGATPVSVNQPGMTYPISSFLEFGQTYYWRIDEVNDACAPYRWPGAVWSFTVNYVSVDDFDPYADQAALRAVWSDGTTNDNGSTVDVETSIIRSGKSLKLQYNSNVGGKDKFSEIEADACDLVIGTDWTPSSAKALALYFYGQPGNDATEQMYVALGDGDGNVAVKDYPRDMNDIKKEEWQQWNINLQDFNDDGVILSNVTKVYIGFGDRFNPQKGGSGIVYFDDVEVHPTRCVDEFVLTADITVDCLVDYADVDVLAGDWLLSDDIVTATEPNSNGLVGWWQLDEGIGITAVDSAGSNNGTHGGTFPLTWFNDPCRGWVLDFDEVGYVSIPSAAFAGISDQITITLWQYGDTEMPLKDHVVMFHATDACSPFDLTIKGEFYNLSAEGCEVFFDAGFGGDASADSVSGLAIPENYQGQWNHYAYTKNANTGEMKIYLNGVLFADQGEDELVSPITGTEITLFKLGSDAADTGPKRYDGYMSDFRLYNYVLTYGEVRHVAGQMDPLYIPLPNPAVDMYVDGKVNFRDYAVLANDWLMETFWP
jgi:hypothetical protein